jgi:hypothetical protein
MRIASLWLLALLASAKTVTFDRASEGKLPPGWTEAMTHQGGAPKWQVVRDGQSTVFAQISTDSTGGRFPIAVYEGATLRDGTVSVKFKPVSGAVDQAAGIIWRYKNADNYYVVRANALEDNVALFKVEKGERTALAPTRAVSSNYAVVSQIPKQRWSTLAVVFRGGTFKVSLNGKELFEVEDSTFNAAGKVGLWTKADNVTYFDAFEFTENK